MSQKKLVICRCEEVDIDQIEEAMESGARTSQELKMKTRAGMGICQGRVCRDILEACANEVEQGLLETSSQLTIHNPVRPVYLGQLKASEKLS